ncbi:MAG: class I SAM-dependent methyltransferase [Candidatus Gottesmanbacteria bacterium]
MNSAKLRLEKFNQFLYKLHPRLFYIVDYVFNLPRYLDCCYLEQLFDKTYQDVLDIGVGKGSLLNFLSKYSRKLTCLDISQKEIKIAQNRFKNKNITFIAADARKLPFINSRFDLIFCNCVIEHIEHDDKVFLEIIRCLNHQGTIIITLPNRDLQADWLKQFVFKHPRFQFLIDPDFKQYFSYKNIYQADEWYRKERWQHTKLGYSSDEICNYLSKLGIKVEKVIYYPNRLLSRVWDIATFSFINKLFPFCLILLVPFFWIIPKNPGTMEHSYEFVIKATKI